MQESNPANRSNTPESPINYLLSLKGAVDYFLAYAERGDRTDPGNFDVGYWLLNGEATQRGVSPAKTRTLVILKSSG